MTSHVNVPLKALSAALVYLEGLAMVAEQLCRADVRDRQLADTLAQALRDMDTDDPARFAPLRYETVGSGIGWEALARNVEDIRSELLTGLASAALGQMDRSDDASEREYEAPEETPRRDIGDRTVVMDVASNQQLMWLNARVVLPIGTVLELPGGFEARVTRIRILDGEVADLCLDCVVGLVR